MIDYTRLQTLRDELGEEDFIEVVEIFIEEVSSMVADLRAAPKLETLSEDLHALKGSALNLGFSAFANLCQAGETEAAQGLAADVALPEILDCYDQSKGLFLAHLQERSAA